MKRVISILLIILAIFTFASCGGIYNPPTPSETVYETLNKIFTKDYPLVNIEVATETKGSLLSSLYTISKEANGKRITYSVEELNKFDKVNGAYIVPESYKSTYNGAVLLSNGNIAEQTGVSINTALGRMRYALINLRKMIKENQLILS